MMVARQNVAEGESPAKLKPCPFCGFKAAGALLDDRPVKLREPLSGAIVAVCPKCLAKGPVHVDQTTEEAIAAWNRRVSTRLDGGKK